MTGESPAPTLTPRLERLLELAAQGVPDKAIAAELGISAHTVDACWRKLREIYGSANRAETIAKHAEGQGARRVAELCAQIGGLEREVATLREANARLTTALEQQNESLVRQFESRARAALANADHWDRLQKLEEAIESSDTVLYEGEIGGLWRKHWATENVARYGFTAAAFVSGEIRIVDYIPAQDAVANMAAFERAVADGAKGFVSYYRIRMPDETYRWLRDHMTIVRDADGEPVRYYGIATDVTDLAAQCDPALLLHPAAE